VRGKPWTISTDDELLFQGDNLVFGRQDPTDLSYWGPLYEKVWAKAIGSYDQVDGGFYENGLRSLTGSPVLSYKTADITTEV
jgi:hypothetical protein